MRVFSVVALDETLDWNAPALVEQAGGTLYTMYAYNPDAITYVDGLVASYRLVPFDIVPRVKPEGDKEWELMYDGLQDGLNHGTDTRNFPCSHIDGLADDFKHSERFDDTETLQDALEHFRGNGTVPEALR
jgi:hypothetical protein